MNQPRPVCSLPFCQHPQDVQTNLSIGLRITAIAVGIIVTIVGICILRGTPGISQLGHTVAGVAISAGGTLVLIAASIKCVQPDLSERVVSEDKGIVIAEEIIDTLQSQMNE